MCLVHKWSEWARCQSSHPSEFFLPEKVLNWEQRMCLNSGCSRMELRKNARSASIGRTL